MSHDLGRRDRERRRPRFTVLAAATAGVSAVHAVGRRTATARSRGGPPMVSRKSAAPALFHIPPKPRALRALARNSHA